MRFPFPPGRPSHLPHLTTCSRFVRAGFFLGLAIALIGMSPQQARYRTGVDLVALNVTVVDQQGRPIGGLTRDDFVVFEDGVRQEVSYFQSDELPTDLVLLIDTSTSMSERMEFVRKTAAQFALALRRGDRGAVFDFNTHVEIRQPLTDDIQALTRVIESTKVGGATALYDAIYIALRELQKQSGAAAQQHVRRQLIVVLSDGDDNASHVSFDALHDEVERGNVTIYTICPQNGTADEDLSVYPYVRRQHAPRINYSMSWLAKETGGAAYMPTTDAELAEAYQHIGREMAQQYLLGYVSKNRPSPGAYRRINIQAMRPEGAKPRTRLGYVG